MVEGDSGEGGGEGFVNGGKVVLVGSVPLELARGAASTDDAPFKVDVVVITCVVFFNNEVAFFVNQKAMEFLVAIGWMNGFKHKLLDEFGI